MKERRRNGEAQVRPTGSDPVGETPGKRSLIMESIEHYAAIALGPEMDPSADNAGTNGLGGGGGGGNAQAGGNVEDPMNGAQGVANGPNGPKTKTSVAFKETTAAPLTFNAKDYKDLYGQVAARVGKEAGSVTRTPTLDTAAPDAQGNIPTAKITYELATMLPAWPQVGSQPQADQAKFNAWKQSVSDHEKGHRDLYKRDLAKVTTQVVGPKDADINSQEDQVEKDAETNQDAYDAAGQPAPLAAPGGIEKIGPNGERQSDNSDGQPPGDGGTAMA